MNQTVAITIVLVCAQLVSLAAVALRLRTLYRLHRQRQHTLITLMSRLPPDTLVELDDSGGDGTRLRSRIATYQHYLERRD